MASKYVISDGGVKIYYTISKNRLQALLFLHGWPHNHTVWNREVKFLSQKGFTTIAMDLRGHGKSDKPTHLKDYALQCFARDIKSILKKEKISKIVLIGHSFGGMVALTYYSLFPRTVKALILLDTIYENPLKHIPFLHYFNLTPLTKLALQYIIDHQHLQRKHFPEINFSTYLDHTDFYYWIKGAKETSIQSVLICLEKMVEFNKKKILHLIKVPTLVLEGEKDNKIMLKDVIYMAKEIKKSRLIIIPNASHDINIRTPRIVEENILRFLETIQ